MPPGDSLLSFPRALVVFRKSKPTRGSNPNPNHQCRPPTKNYLNFRGICQIKRQVGGEGGKIREPNNKSSLFVVFPTQLAVFVCSFLLSLSLSQNQLPEHWRKWTLRLKLRALSLLAFIACASFPCDADLRYFVQSRAFCLNTRASCVALFKE